MTAIVEARGVTRELGTQVKTRVLRGVDLSIPAGQSVALTGASGSGKSTLLYLLGALDRPTEGEVRLDGVEIGHLDDDERALLRGQQLGFVFQFHFLIAELNVLENVALPLWRRGIPHDDAVARSRAVLSRLGP